MDAWDRYVEAGVEGLTHDEREALQDAFLAAMDAAADNYRKAEQ
jgi:hypothetical protein